MQKCKIVVYCTSRANRRHIITYTKTKAPRNVKEQIFWDSWKGGVSPLAASVTFFLCRRRALDTVARLGRAIRVSSGSSDITAACDDDVSTVKSVILFFIFPTAFRARAMLTIASVVVTWIPATDHPVAGCSESCFTFHCLMISTAPRYCSVYVFLVLTIFKISIQNCRFSFTRYTVLQSHARPISVSHRYRQSVQCIHSRLNV